MYWHLLLEEYLRRSSKNAEFNYLPNNISTCSAKVSSRQNFRFDLDNGYYLTQRELECSRLLLLGFNMRRVAVELSLSHRTVEYYISRLRDRWKCKNKKELLSMLRLLKVDSIDIDNIS